MIFICFSSSYRPQMQGHSSLFFFVPPRTPREDAERHSAGLLPPSCVILAPSWPPSPHLGPLLFSQRLPSLSQSFPRASISLRPEAPRAFPELPNAFPKAPKVFPKLPKVSPKPREVPQSANVAPCCLHLNSIFAPSSLHLGLLLAPS